MKKPYDYRAKPTRALERKLLREDRPLHFLDWDYIAECVQAHETCRKLSEYLSEKIPKGEPLSDDIVCFLVTGFDRDQLINYTPDKPDILKETENGDDNDG